MTATKKSIRFLTSLFLVFTMVFFIVSVPVSAAGVENWYAGNSYSYIYENEFTIRGYNLTPVKTCYGTGVMNINVEILQILDSASNSNPINFTIQICSTSGAVLSGFTANSADFKNGFPHGLWTSCNISNGQKIQIYIGAYDAITGNYRTVRLKYGHCFIGS